MAESLTICITRQFGSGGREVGLALSKLMDIGFYDKELLQAAAEKSGILQELFEKNDEKPVSGLFGALPIEGKTTSFADYAGFVQNDTLQSVLAEVIRDAADAGPCVIIGRCADYILRGNPGTLSVFIHAPLEQRIHRIARLHNLDEDAARSLIRKTDRGRANYYSYFTDRDWGAIDNYDLCLDTGRLGVDGAAQIIHCAAGHLAH